MATFDEDLLRDDEENRREMAFIRTQLPSEAKDKYTDAQLLFVMDAIGEYIVESGILDSDDDEVDIDIEAVADYACKEAKTQGIGMLDPQEVFFIVQADLDFQEENA